MAKRQGANFEKVWNCSREEVSFCLYFVTNFKERGYFLLQKVSKGQLNGLRRLVMAMRQRANLLGEDKL